MELRRSDSTVRQQYGEDMTHSLRAFELLPLEASGSGQFINTEGLPEALQASKTKIKRLMNRIRESLGQGLPETYWLQYGGIGPCVTTVTILQQLQIFSRGSLSPGMREALVAFAIAIAKCQRLARINDAHRRGKQTAFIEELNNRGHENWDPMTQIDWLLLEIDANVLLRPSQVDVALATISPSSGSNSVLQMNMGQGKTSCIIPMAAANLANGKQVLRVVLPKPLLLQTAQLMQSRLSGLVGRKLIHVPFSRKTITSPEMLKSYLALHQHTLQYSGIIVTLPEHIMSFMLSG